MPGLYNITFASELFLPDRFVRKKIQRDVERLSGTFGGPVTFEGFEEFKNHRPYALKVRPREIRDGFYTRLNALQGHRGTYYLGAAIETHGSFAVWSQADSLITSVFA